MTLRCVLVDDSPRFLASARGLLEGEGVSVVGVATTGADAQRLVLQLRPDVALVDIDLGAESGFDVARQLRDWAGVPAPAVILISTHAGQDYADLIEASPAVGFLAKTTLSGAAIRDLLRDGDPGPVSEPRGKR